MAKTDFSRYGSRMPYTMARSNRGDYMQHSTTARVHDVTHREEEHVTGWIGWVAFASFMMILTGIFQIIAGLIGIFNQSWYAVNAHTLLVFSTVHAWGWAYLIIGIVVLLAGISLLSGAMWARTIAVVMAAISAVSYLVSISLYPIWSIIGITIAVLVIYATVVHGHELRELQ